MKVVISIKPEFANKIFDGTKKFEFRKSIFKNEDVKTEAKAKPVTHWKKLTNPNYIGAHDLQPGQEVKITIKSVAKEMVKGVDGKEEELIVARLEKTATGKPMILNKTNCRIISKVLDTPYIEEWAGRSVIIYSAKVKAFGDFVDALRVKNQKV